MGKHSRTLEERFWEGVAKTDDDSCWLWTKGQRTKGYGGIRFQGVKYYAHRVAYELLVGPIPEGWDVGHKCHDEAALAGLCDGKEDCPHHACCNPAHLKAEPRKDNLNSSVLWRKAVGMQGEPTAELLSSGSVSAIRPSLPQLKSRPTHCQRNHPFDEANTRIKKDGTRSCKACSKMTPEERKAWDEASAA